MNRSKIATGLVAGLMMLAGASAASAQIPGYEGPGTTEPVQVPTVGVSQGDVLDLNGTGCTDGDTVTVTFDDGTTLGTATANPFGNFTARVTVPASASVGVHTVTASCGCPAADAGLGGGTGFNRAVGSAGAARVAAPAQAVASYDMAAVAPCKNEIKLDVRAGNAGVAGTQGGTGSSGALARTGSNVLPLVGIASAAVLLGGAFVYGARRPRQA